MKKIIITKNDIVITENAEIADTFFTRFRGLMFRRTIADDYAHHPKELEVTLNAAKKMGYNKVIAVFQPFTYSRTKMLFDDFVEVLKIADKCLLTEIMGSRETDNLGMYSSMLAEKIPDCEWFNSFEEISERALELAEENDLIITLGCGDIYKAAKIMIKKLEEKQK